MTEKRKFQYFTNTEIPLVRERNAQKHGSTNGTKLLKICI